MNLSIIAKTLTIAAVAAFVLGISPKAKADCSEATLKGHHFAYTSTGPPLPPDPSLIVGAVCRGGMQHFDGNGNITFITI